MAAVAVAVVIVIVGGVRIGRLLPQVALGVCEITGVVGAVSRMRRRQGQSMALLALALMSMLAVHLAVHLVAVGLMLVLGL